jgi:hypothetical protein
MATGAPLAIIHYILVVQDIKDFLKSRGDYRILAGTIVDLLVRLLQLE